MPSVHGASMEERLKCRTVSRDREVPVRERSAELDGLAAYVEEGLTLRNHRHSLFHVHAIGEEVNNSPVAKPPEWTKTLLARNELCGWSGLGP